MRQSRRRVVLSNRAQDDREAIYIRGLDTWGDGQADTYMERLFRALAEVSSYPEIGRARDDLRSGVRALPVGQHVVYYVITQDEIQVTRILHRRQDPSRAIGV